MPVPSIAAFWFAIATRPADSLNLPVFFSTNMVLPREPLAARLWGFEESPGAKISVSVDGVEVGSANADSNGDWMFEFEPQVASGDKIVDVMSSSGDSETFTNVAFGDVYLCSGQSNMEMAVNAMENATEEIADSVNYPDLRFFSPKGMTGDNATYRNPNFRSKSSNYNWMQSKPNMFIKPTDKNVFQFPSATCYFFARDLYKSLGGDVPIGFVASTWSNMPIQVFSSPDALADATCGGTKEANSIVVKDSSQLKASQYERDQGMKEMMPSQVWFGAIWPFAKMRFSGVLWYQGESNVDDPEGYACLFPAMIADWRQKFELPDLEFYFVQVSTGYLPWGKTLTPDNALSPEIRQAQLSGLLLENTAVVPSYDLGEPNLGIASPSWQLGSLHPRRKQELGRRLALAVQKMHYNLDVVATGPVFDKFSQDSDSGELSISFTSHTAKGLHFVGTPDCTTCCDASPFEVRTVDGTWMETTGHVVNGNKVTFTLAAGPAGALDTVRYAYSAVPQCGLYNGAGGPDDHAGIVALPFVQAVDCSDDASFEPVTHHQQAEVFVPDAAAKRRFRKGSKEKDRVIPDQVDSGALFR